jgi:hypothetical protein
MARKKTSPPSNKALEALMSGEKLSTEDQSTLREYGDAQIDAFMMAVGYKEPARFTDKNGWRHLQLESAEGIAGITISENELYLHVEALVMALPSDKDLIQALMREALELNCTLPGGCSLGIRGSQLVASATENMRLLNSAAEYGSILNGVMALANTMDESLKEKYGGTSKTRTTVRVAKPA